MGHRMEFSPYRLSFALTLYTLSFVLCPFLILSKFYIFQPILFNNVGWYALPLIRTVANIPDIFHTDLAAKEPTGSKASHSIEKSNSLLHIRLCLPRICNLVYQLQLVF